MVRWGRQEQSNKEFYSEEQIRRVIESCGINIEYEIESDYIIYCPFHNNYRTPAGEISKESGLFYCFGCQESKGLAEVVMFTTKRTFFEATRMIESKKIESNIVDDISKILAKNESLKEFDLSTVHRLNSVALSSHRAADYLRGRSITKDSVEKYLIGYSEKQDMITIPIFSVDNICLGMVGRSIEGKQFKNTPGLPRNKTFFNISRNKAADKIFLVESSFDAIRLEQVGAKALASLGASTSSYQRELLKKYFNSIIVVSDNDDAGNTMKEKLKAALGSKVIAAKLPEEIKDVSDMDDTSLKTFIDTFNNEIEYILN